MDVTTPSPIGRPIAAALLAETASLSVPSDHQYNGHSTAWLTPNDLQGANPDRRMDNTLEHQTTFTLQKAHPPGVEQKLSSI